MDQDIILEMKHITKVYPGVTALNDVSIDLRRGEVLALLGENGAGKSTLMKVLSGIVQPTAGEIVIAGKKAEMKSITDARRLGVSIIHQELNLIGEMDAAQNIFLGREPKRFGNVIDKKKLYLDTQQIMDSLGLHLDIRTPVKKLSVARRQMIEIGKALSFGANIIIMDEPTAPLTTVEINELFRIIRGLKAEGRSVIYISHRLEEIPAICDRASILRDGCYIGTDDVARLDRDTMITMMAGRVLNDLFPKTKVEIGETLFEVKNLNTDMLHDISFTVRRGEILALTGLVGAGRTETVRAIFGVDPRDAGEIYIGGKPVSIKKPADAIRHGIAFLTEDRKEQGFVPLMSVKENITLPGLRPLQRGGVIRGAKELGIVDKYVNDLRIKTPSIHQKVKFLSGGNQQKVVLAKWLNLDADVIILDEPTRGIDVGAKSEIYAIMGEIAKKGKAIIMISSEMEEVMAVSDRAVILCEGRITGTLDRKDFAQETIMSYAMGGVS
ncbi:sugar ABC transporter ATP-binding protein [Butyricicoccus faecihominis]|uniref:sugar ABC transporter ATP-binding protein n=1 Tax=Butyricicoccus faecihominis TaxID=1712515 RepID=UPI00247997ED|nr:sugar ABC transporter ATP-binding protein [Butyricicoccus faecihominis]MCQ5131471.1 sugar ABC transporter ATP-binding protein [Butyricicoccus faecihominis]